MATPKTITAYDIEQGKLTIVRSGTTLTVERRYIFLDVSDNPITNLAGGRVLEEIEVSALPPTVANALQTIDNWTYNKALIQEGMD